MTGAQTLPHRANAGASRWIGHPSLPSRILSLLGGVPRATFGEVTQALPDAKVISLSAALVRLVNDGRVEQIGRGLYRIAPGAPPLDNRIDLARTFILGLPPGTVLDARLVIRGAGVAHNTVTGAMADLLRAGEVQRLARGTYARIGAPPRLDAFKLRKVPEVLRILVAHGASMRTQEVQAQLVEPDSPFAAAHTLRNMLRDGHVVRVARSTWAVTDKGREAARPFRVPAPREVVLEALAGGGAWKAADLAALCGARQEVVEGVLRDLEAEGAAVYVVLGAWRSSAVAATLRDRPNGLLIQLLAPLLDVHGPYTTEMVRPDQGGRTNSQSPAFAELGNLGIVVSLGYGVRMLVPAWRAALSVRLGAVGPRPALTARGRELVEAIRDSGPLTKAEIAAMAGTNRGVAIRLVDRLVGEGRMVEVAPGRFMLG